MKDRFSARRRSMKTAPGNISILVFLWVNDGNIPQFVATEFVEEYKKNKNVWECPGGHLSIGVGGPLIVHLPE
jgi:hypothetical protein